MKKPERIYLVSPDISEEEDAGPGMGSDFEGVYWSEDQIHASDVPYIRADIAAAPKGLAEVRATLLHLAKACNARGFDSLIDSSLSQKFWYGLRDEGYAAIEVLDALAQPQSADDQAQDD